MTPSPYTAQVPFRSYTPDDRAACLDLFGSNTPAYFDPAERALFEAFLDGQPQPYFVLEEGGQIIACGGVAIHPDLAAGVALSPTSAGLTWGMAARGWHGRGVGTRLLRGRLDWIRAHRPEVQEVHLATSQLTQGYYARQGFRVVRRDPDGFAPGLDKVEMVLHLNAPDRPRAAAVVLRAANTEVLMVQHRSGDSSTYWQLPGGGLAPGETAGQAAVRELLEETGLVGRAGAELFRLPYRNGTSHAVEVWVAADAQPTLGHDPEELGLHRKLIGVAWQRLMNHADNPEIEALLQTLNRRT